MSRSRIDFIRQSEFLSKYFNVLLLLNPKRAEQVFKVSSEELESYKNNIFNYDYLVSLGEPYIIDYLQSYLPDMVKIYQKGEDFLVYSLSGKKDREALYNNLIDSVLLDSQEAPINVKLKTLKELKDKVRSSESPIDILSDILKKSGEEI